MPGENNSIMQVELILKESPDDGGFSSHILLSRLILFNHAPLLEVVNKDN
jgi:hypothetical protein